jgi:hypothetical protein
MEKNTSLEQRYAVEFCVKLGETALPIPAFGCDSVSRAQVFRWHKDFSNRRQTIADKPRSGRAASVRESMNVVRVKVLIRQGRHLTIRMIADELNTNECTVQKIVTQDFNTRKVCAKTVPKDLNDDRKECRNELSVEVLQRL